MSAKYKHRWKVKQYNDRFRIGFEWMMPFDEDSGAWFSFDFLIWSIYLDWEPRT